MRRFAERYKNEINVNVENEGCRRCDEGRQGGTGSVFVAMIMHFLSSCATSIFRKPLSGVRL